MHQSFLVIMPFKPFKRGSEYCVYKIDADGNAVGESRGCHDTREEAVAQIRAIEANMDEKSLGYLYERPSRKSFFRVEKSADGRLMWVAGAYSNSFRDEDNPPEIIAANSHKRFARMVWEGEVAPPDAWVWHESEWKFGTGSWVSYDEVAPGIVFAIAGGYVDEGAEELALALDAMQDKALSHGMPLSSIAREEQDPSIIIEHITEEVSVLPVWAAANKLTAQRFTVMEEKMAIPNKKELLEKESIKPELLDEIENANKETATKAVTEGMAFKEASDSDEANAEAVDVESSVAKEAEEVSEDVQEDEVVEEEVVKEVEIVEPDYEAVIAKALEPVVVKINDALTQLSEQVVALQKENEDLRTAVEEMNGKVGELSVSDEEKISAKMSETPLAGLASLINFDSIVGRKEAHVDGRSSLAKSGPAESESGGAANGLFIEKWMNGG